VFALSLALRLLLRVLLFAGNVLEELLDQIDVGQDHAAAAVALETDGVEGVAGRVGWLARERK
tara:strand:- start:3741 stop:3929 length:189 start_codon:yes stop_codon:yes gene_type:complete